jgi:hypothetical protein
LFVNKPQNFLTGTTAAVASSPWSTPSTPARLCTPSTTASPTLVSAKALEMRATSSIPPPVASSSRESVLDSGSLQVPPFSKSGPLGSEGESISVEELGIRSRPLVQSYAWDSLSEGSKKVFVLNWKLFSNFGALHGSNVNKFSWDFSFVCEYMLFHIQNSGSIHSVLSA